MRAMIAMKQKTLAMMIPMRIGVERPFEDDCSDSDVDEVDGLSGGVKDDHDVELIGRDVVMGGGGAHLLRLLQSHGNEQSVKQF